MPPSKWKVESCLRKNLLTILTATGVFAGVALGFILKGAKGYWDPSDISYVKFVEDLFLNILKGLILPLVIFSLVAAVGSLDLSLSKKVGVGGIILFAVTTLSAIILGITLALAIRPGLRMEMSREGQNDTDPTTVQDTLMDLIRNMFPPNLVQATLAHYRTELILPAGKVAANSTPSRGDFEMRGHWETGTNYMGLIVFSISVGIVLSHIGSRGKPLMDVCQCLSDCMMILINWVIWFSPLGVMFLVAGEILRIEDFGTVVWSLGLYFGTIVAGLVIHGMVVLPLLFFVLTGKLPFKYTANLMPAMAIAFGTGSSTATLPFTMKCVEELNGVDRRVSRFLLPIGATVNMDGTALFQAVAAIFLSQVVGISLTVGKIITIGVTSVAASIAAAGIPHGGFVTMVMLLNTIGLPVDYLAYIVPIDWLVDRLRTPINVLGDSIVAGILNNLCKEELERLPPMHIPDDKHLLADERVCPDCNV